MGSEHDKRYKKLFSNPILLQELIFYFVNEDFVKELDFSTLDRLDKSFITDEFKSKESDIIYRINFRGKDIYIYLLIEFQSTVDQYLAIRILRYMMEFYEFLIQSRKIDKKEKSRKPLIPAVFPILLYNGTPRWTAKTNIKELIRNDLPSEYIPDFSYYKIIENEIPKEVLLKIKNAVSAIFYVENSTPDKLREEIRDVLGLIAEEHQDVIKLLRNWLNNLFGYKQPIYII
jgi:hypothetical protein